MPNFKGGKKYKSGKGDETKADLHEINTSDRQMAGRVIKNLGDRNMLIYCNDGRERICHIRGGLRKKVAKIEVGDIVLISIRSMEEGSTMKDRGDILAKFEREVHGQLKKEIGINETLFLSVETMDSRQRAIGVKPEDDCGFDFDQESEDEGAGVDEATANTAREKRKDEEERKRASARNAKQEMSNTDDINIDDI